VPGLGSPAGAGSEAVITDDQTECERTNGIRHRRATDPTMDGHPGGLGPPGYNKRAHGECAPRKALRAPYRPPLESPSAQGGGKAINSRSIETGIGLRRTYDSARRRSETCGWRVKLKQPTRRSNGPPAGVRTPRPCRGVFELLFLGSYLPTFKERYPDPEGPVRDGGSRI